MSARRLPAGARVGSFTALSLRSLRARPLRSALTAGAITLGVGMVFGVLLLTNTIHSTFDRLYDSIYGRADLVVSGEESVGSVPLSTIDRVRAVPGVASASGDVFNLFRAVDDQGKVERGTNAQVFVTGVDYAEPDPTTSVQVAGRNPRGARELELQRDWAEERGIAVGDRLPFSTPSGVVTFTVAGIFDFEGGLNLGGYGTASMPIDAARVVMDKPGVWDEITVVAEDGVDPQALLPRVEAALPDGVVVETPATKSDEVDDELASLDVTLSFFGGIALFVGAFLILNSFNMTVLQRMRELGTLRALGARRGRVARTVLVEAVVLGLVGAVLGLGLGVLLARGMVEMMQSFGLPVSGVELSAGAAVTAVIVGLVATLAGAAWPALRAGRIAPVRALIGTGLHRGTPGLRRAIAGTLLFVPGLVVGGLFWFRDTSGDSALVQLGGVSTTFVMFAGMVLLAPFVVLPLTRVLAWPLRRVMPAEGRLAADAANANPARTSATAATLLVALSVVVVNATMASSFVGSLSDELDQRFSRDLTVQPVGYQEFGPPQGTIASALRDEIAAMPEAGAVARRRSLYISELPGGGQEGLLIGVDPREYDEVDQVRYVGASRAEALQGMEGGGIVVAEIYADEKGLEVGDRLEMRGPSGTRSPPIVALADTFDAGGHTIQMSLGTLAAVYGVRTDTQLAVKAASEEQRDALAAKVDALLASRYPGLEAQSNAELKQQTEDAIDQQFAFFNAIVGIAVIVGVLGIVNTLSMSVIERTREIGVLRALGASRWRVRRTMANESLLISLAGTIAGLAAGLLVAVVWIVALQQSTFPGMALILPTGMLIGIAVLGVVVGVLAAVLPARRAAKLDPLGALRYE